MSIPSMFRRAAAAAVLVLAFAGMPAAQTADPLVAKSKALFDDKKYAEAVKELTAVIERDPRHAQAVLYRGMAHRRLSQLPEALNDLTRAIELDPKNFLPYEERAQANRTLNRVPEAIQDAESAVKLAPPKDAARMFVAQSNFYRALNDLPGAAKACERAKSAELSPNTLVCAGSVYLSMEQWDKALPNYEQIIKMNDTLFFGYYGRGRASMELGRPAQARKDFDTVARLKPEVMKNADVQQALARLSAMEKGEKPPELAKPAAAPLPKPVELPKPPKGDPAQNKALVEAVGRKDAAAASAAIAKGADPGAKASNGFPVLLTAAMNNQPEMASLLLAKGADPNSGNGDGYTALHRFASEGNAEMTKALLDKGADPKGRTRSGLTALMAAAGNGRTQIVRMLLDKGADAGAAMQEQGSTALTTAAYGGHPETVQVLLERGAPVNAQMKDGNTALMLAAYMGAGCTDKCRFHEAVDALLAKGAQVHLRNGKQETALMLASCQDNEDTRIVKALLAKGADPNAKKPGGETSLICAAEKGNQGTVKELLARGADPNARTNDGMTAMKKAVKRWGWQADEMVKVLKAAGARE